MPYGIIQYQGKTEAPPALLVIQFFESAWHQPWSEPVRHKIDPRLRIALNSASGQAPIGPPDITVFKISWFDWLSEPVRFKAGLPPTEQAFFQFEPEPPIYMDIPWFNWLSGPVRIPVGLKSHLQQTLAYPSRLLPPVNVTGTMNAIETNMDEALFGVYVYSGTLPSGGAASANVSIAEIPIKNNAFGSIEET